jgi:hypothetical protein
MTGCRGLAEGGDGDQSARDDATNGLAGPLPQRNVTDERPIRARSGASRDVPGAMCQGLDIGQVVAHQLPAHRGPGSVVELRHIRLAEDRRRQRSDGLGPLECGCSSIASVRVLRGRSRGSSSRRYHRRRGPSPAGPPWPKGCAESAHAPHTDDVTPELASTPRQVR